MREANTLIISLYFIFVQHNDQLVTKSFSVISNVIPLLPLNWTKRTSYDNSHKVHNSANFHNIFCKVNNSANFHKIFLNSTYIR